MKLLQLKLENFQGIQALTLDFEGQNVALYGDNATGKTTVYNAYTWLLFDKASTGAKSFTPKTRGPGGELHGLDHAAEGRFELEDGRVLTLRKVYREIWKKKKGAATAEFSGNTVDYYLDGVPVKEQEYAAALERHCGGAERMMLLTMPAFFPEQLPWDRRRAILLEVCGDVSDEDVMASEEALADLSRRLTIPGTVHQKYTVAEYKKLMTARRTEINRQLQEIPGRVDEASRAKPDVLGLDLAALQEERRSIAERRASLERERAQVAAGGAESAAQKALAQAKERLTAARMAHTERLSKVAAARQVVDRNLQDQLDLAKRERDSAQYELRTIEEGKARLERKRRELLQSYEAVQGQQWDESEAVCPTCRRPLPDDQVEELKSDFHLRRSQRLQEINEQGHREASKDMIQAAADKYQQCLERAATAKAALEKLEAKLDQRAQDKSGQEAFEGTQEHAVLQAEVDACQAAVMAGAADLSKVLAPYDDQLAALEEDQRVNGRRLAALESAKAQEDRVQELLAEEKRLGAEFEQVEQGIYLCELFVRTKVAMLTNRINDKFQSVRFRLFQEQLNGGIKEDCEVMISAAGGSLVPFAFANNAARIGAGLEIIGVLAAHWGTSMPVFVDNAEGVTRLPGVDAQVIRLVVSAGDAALRLEREGGTSELGEVC